MEQKELQAIVCISESLAKECMDFGVPKQKIIVMHSGVDLSECDDVVEAELPDFTQTHSLAVYVGSLQKGKGIEQILRMAELTSDINFLIVGGHSGQIEEHDNLKHISQVSHEKALAYMKKADFLLLPLTEQSYKFHSPLKLFEYLAMGKTVIASDNADIREIIAPMENGMLADPAWPEDFLKKMEQVCRQPQLRKHLEENAKRRAAQFTWEIRAKRIVDLVRRKNDEKE
jgi:glycosyltransferase involved in cell wall biosynthesis